MNDRFKSSLISVGSSFSWLLYDTKSKSLVEPLCDYADDMVLKAQLSELTVSQEMGYLRVFYAFVVSSGKNVDEASDNLLKDFRDYSLCEAKSGRAHRGSEEAAKRTTNAKLIRIYDWLRWLQDTERVRSGFIGPRHCRITSGLERSSVLHARRTSSQMVERYPLLFRLRSGKSKHGMPKFIPTEDTVDNVYAHFHANATSSHVVHRNCLIASIASYTGFRRASIQSLLTTQFDALNLVHTERDSVLVQPLRQKFGYGDVFEIPGWLLHQVVDFIRSHRNEVVTRTGADRRIHADHLFLSDRTGRPLQDRTFTALMSRALRATGAGKGAAMHAWRSKFAIEVTEESYEIRSALGLDTSIETMDSVVARSLGHKSPLSARAYTSAHEASEVSRVRAQREKSRLTDKNRIAHLEAELARLKGDLPSM
jgi:site-specific recombinase XerD